MALVLLLSRLPAERAALSNSGSENHSVSINVEDTHPSRNAVAVASYSEAVKRAAPSVVNIYSSKTVTDSSDNAVLSDPILRHFFGDHLVGSPEEHSKPHRSQSLGSGVICTADGYILTNFHVVDDADDIRVNLADGRTEYSAKMVGADPQTDVAIVKINATNLPAITMGDSDELRVGDVVLAVGNPFGVGQTVTMGIASAVGRGGFGVEDVEDFIQTDASINPGNSGGALIDAHGRLIGLNAAILSRSGGNQGIGFAIPVNLARESMEQILKYGRVMRGYLGVTTQALTPDLAKAFKLPQKQTGALVGEVSPNSPAASAGLKEGDIITSFNGKAVNGSRELGLLIAQSSPNRGANVQVLRQGKTKRIKMTLAEVPRAKAQEHSLNTKATRVGDSDNSNESSLDAVEISDLSSEVRQMLEIPAAINGAVVAKVEPGSDSYEAGLRVGDVITDVNGQLVKNADVAIQLCHRTRGGMALLRVWSKDGKHYVAVNNQVASK
jgi:serine protease Do